MAMLVSFKEASDHLRLDETIAEKSDLTLKIKAASAIVLNYVEMEADDFLDSSDDETYDVPDDMKAAILLLIGDMHRYRDSGAPTYSEATLPSAVRAILYPLKTWGLDDVS